MVLRVARINPVNRHCMPSIFDSVREGEYRQPRNNAVRPCAFGLKLFRSCEIAGFQGGLLIAPKEDSSRVDAMTASKFRSGAGDVELLEYPDDLGFGKPSFLHVSFLKPRSGRHSLDLSHFAILGHRPKTLRINACNMFTRKVRVRLVKP